MIFVLHELEKLLHGFITNQRYSSNKKRPRISLADINRFSVDQLQFDDKAQLEPISIGHKLQTETRDAMKCFDFESNQLTTDLVFAMSMKTILLDRLIQMPQRSFPSARIMICDRKSYELIAKFQYITQRISLNNNNECKFFIYKQPFNITAIILLDEIVDTIESLKRPFVSFKRDQNGKQGASYEYSIIRQVFPYLRITDLALVLEEIGTFRMKTFTIDGKREHQILQFITHFARSTQLIELQSIRKLIGRQHPMYDNVSIFQPHLIAYNVTKDAGQQDQGQQQQQQQQEQQQQQRKYQQDTKKLVAGNYHLTPKLFDLTLIANRLINLVQHLGWFLESITFRAGDPTGFTKIFSQILDSTLKYNSKANKSQGAANRANVSIIPVRLLVLDRFVDLQGLLRHANHYGSFVEQEMVPSPARAKTGPIDCLFRRLCSDKLTDVLGTILRLSVDIKPGDMVTGQRQPVDSKQQQQQQQRRFTSNQNDVKLSTLSINQAIHKHLDIIKSMYKALNEGYLLLLKLESNIETILDSLRNLNAPMDERDQDETAERLKRIGTAFKQLVDVKSGSIKLSDAMRFANMLIDAISVFLFLHPKARAAESLIDLKTVFVFGKEFRNSLKAIIELHGNDLIDDNDSLDDEAVAAMSADLASSQPVKKGALKAVDLDVELTEKLDNFDAISSEMCANRSLLTLEEIVECFYKRQLDVVSHPCLKLSSTATGLIKSGSKNKIIVLLLGSITYDELNRLKSLEARLMRSKYVRMAQGADESHSQSDILTIACNLIRPKDFLKSL